MTASHPCIYMSHTHTHIYIYIYIYRLSGTSTRRGTESAQMPPTQRPAHRGGGGMLKSNLLPGNIALHAAADGHGELLFLKREKLQDMLHRCVWVVVKCHGVCL
jgi:hypothetical protein